MIYLFNQNPTDGKQDGQKVSEGGNMSNPIKVTLNATQNEISEPIKLAIRTDEDYKTAEGTDVKVSIVGATASKWKLSLTEDFEGREWGQELVLTAPEIKNANRVIWAMAMAEDSESATVDVSVKLRLEAVIQSIG